MLKIINKLFPFLSKKHDEITEEQYLQHWKTMPHLTVNQIAYLYNGFRLSSNYTHEQTFQDLSENEQKIAEMMRFQLLAAIEDHQLIAKDYDHQSESAKKKFNNNPIISKKELFKYLTSIDQKGTIPGTLIPQSPKESITYKEICELKELKSKLKGWEPAISHPSEGLKGIADFINQIYFKDGKAITKMSHIPGYKDKEQLAESLLENKKLKLVQLDISKPVMISLLTIISTLSTLSKKRGPVPNKKVSMSDLTKMTK